MAHANGRIYIDTSGTSPVGVSIGDIQSVLGSAKNDIGQLITAVDSNNKSLINKSSKFKPVRYPQVGATFANTPTLYRDVDNKCGIEIPVLTATEFALSTIQSLITGADDYSYLGPRGKATNNEWFRFLDFNNYDHGASLNAQFIPPTVSNPGFININGQHVFTLRLGNLYTKSNTVSASVLSLVDLMMRWADSNGDIHAYDGSTSFTENNPVNNGTSYGILGILLIYTSSIDGSVQVCLCSHSLGVTSADNNELAIDFSTVYSDSGAPQPQTGDTVFLAPCFTNLNTNGAWAALISNTNYPAVKCGLFPKVTSGSSSVDYVSYTLYTPTVTLAVLSYSIYGVTRLTDTTFKFNTSGIFAGITVTAGTGVLGTGNTFRITNVNPAYSGAVSNTLIGNLTFDSNRQATFRVEEQDGNGNSIFIQNYIPIQIQILSADGEYQNDIISIYAYNAPNA